MSEKRAGAAWRGGRMASTGRGGCAAGRAYIANRHGHSYYAPARLGPVEAGSWALIVEDDALDVQAYRQAFSEIAPRLRIEHRSTVEEAWEYFLAQCGTENKPGFVVVDMALPGQAGLEFLHRVRESPDTDGVPIAVCSGSILAADRERSLAAGADTFLVKPEKYDDLMQLCRDLCDAWLDERVRGD